MNAKQKTTILIVGNTPEAILLTGAMIHRPDFNLIAATSGQEAQSMTRMNDVALIILNMNMPVSDGLGIITKLRNNPENRHIPIILITDKHQEDQCKSICCKSESIDYLAPPFDSDMLNRKIEIFLTLKQAWDDLKKIKNNLRLEIKHRKYIENEIMYRDKLEGVIETAVAVCHELTQPLQSIAGYSDLILMNADAPRDLHQRIQKIKDQVSRITGLTQELMGITRYKTKAYLGKTKTVDLDLIHERRKHKRFIPQTCTILIPHFYPIMQGQVIDISRDGLAFWSNEPDVAIPPGIIRASLSLPGKNISLDNLPCRFLNHQTQSHVMVLNHNRMKRHSIRFEPLIDTKLNQLEDFILNHTSAKTE